MRRNPRIWQDVPWSIVQTLRRAGLRVAPCPRSGAVDIPPQRAPELGWTQIQGILYWIPRWPEDGPALYLARTDHWDRAANAPVIVSAIGLTPAAVLTAVREAVRLAAEADLSAAAEDLQTLADMETTTT